MARQVWQRVSVPPGTGLGPMLALHRQGVCVNSDVSASALPTFHNPNLIQGKQRRRVFQRHRTVHDDKGQCTAYDAAGEEYAGAVHCPYTRILHTIAVWILIR